MQTESAAAVDLTSLRSSIERRIADADAEFGVCVRHLPSGQEILIHPDELYPMASVFKIPILIAALAQIDQGRHSLDARVPIGHEVRVPPSGILTELDPGLQPTLHDLLMLMIIVSDNMATDLVLERVGLESVEAQMRSYGLQNISIKMSVKGLFDTAFGATKEGHTLVDLWRRLAAEGQRIDTRTGRPPAILRELREAAQPWDTRAAQRYLQNNVASPRDMGVLLERLLKGELLSEGSTATALDILLRQQLNMRLPRFLADGVPIAHKTGTFLNSRNDAGIIYLPDGTHLVVITFAVLRRDLLDADRRVATPYIDRVDSAMGLIARDAYDAFAPGEVTKGS